MTQLWNNHPRSGGWRLTMLAAFREILQSAAWERFITAIIIVNAITLGLETSETITSRIGGLLWGLDRLFLTIFVLEIAARLAVFGRSFWRDGWSIFDFIVVAVALVPTTESFSVLRALRVLRVLRLISTIKSMRRVVSGLLAAIPSMGTVIALLALIFYVCSVMATKMFSESFPELFGTIASSAFSLFQIMTLEGWAAEIVRPVMEKYPYAWIFFIIFMLVTSFAVLNLFIGIIVDSMQNESELAQNEDRRRSAANFDTVLAELKALRSEVAELRKLQQGGRMDRPQSKFEP